MKTRRRLAAVVGATLFAAVGCQQKMAEQPYYRPYEPSGFFADGRSNRPLEAGTVHRNQRFEDDPLVTGLTADEWATARKYGVAPKADAAAPTDQETVERNVGAPRFPPGDARNPFVTDYPMEITPADLRRGQERYTVFCSACHGPLGNGRGKIWERGLLKPTSFHTEAVAGEKPSAEDLPDLGFSRGYWRWGIKVPLREAPVGYFFEVITRGYGGMASYSAQVPPADRWRIIAYIRALQLSQHAAVADLPEGVRGKVPASAEGKK